MKHKTGMALFSIICFAFCIDAPATEYDIETIIYVQEYLNSNGYDCGTADGIIGSKTSDSIMDFQRDHDLEVTGQITDQLLRQMENPSTEEPEENASPDAQSNEDGSQNNADDGSIPFVQTHLDLMDPVIHAYAQLERDGEVDLSSGDNDYFWSMVRLYGIFRSQYDYINGIKKEGETGFFSPDEVKEIGYSLFNDFNGNIPEFEVDPSHGKKIIDGKYYLSFATPRQQQFDLLSSRVNEDGSIDACYSLKYWTQNGSGMDFVEISKNYVLLVPNPEVNPDSSHPLYYRIMAMTSVNSEQEDTAQMQTTDIVDLSDTIGKQITEIGDYVDIGRFERRSENFYSYITGVADDLSSKGIFITTYDNGNVKQVDLDKVSEGYSIQGVYPGMAVSEAVSILHRKNFSFGNAGSTKGVLNVWAGYNNSNYSISFVTDQQAVHGTVTTEQQINGYARITSISVAGNDNFTSADSEFMDLEPYKTSYLKVIEERENGPDNYTYYLIYVDDNDIPELVIDSGYRAAGCYVYTYNGENTDSIGVRYPFTYVERQNYVIWHDILNNGEQDYVWILENGKWKQIVKGFHRIDGGRNQYEWDGEILEAEEYHARLEAAVGKENQEKAITPYDKMTYDEVITAIKTLHTVGNGE